MKVIRNSLSVKQQISILSSLVSRSAMMAQLGQSYDGKRNLYESLGYPVVLNFDNFFTRYIRQDIAKRLVNAFPDACWSKPPDVKEMDSENVETDFEKAWKELTKRIPIWSYMKRIDRMSGVGKYGVLLMGFDDTNSKNPEKPVTKATKLLYLRPFYEKNATILEWETDPTNERYGLPKIYQLSFSQPQAGGNTVSRLMKVHYTRVLHIADELTEDDINGTPRLEAVYNRLQDIEMIAGGGAEMWWRGAFPGLNFTPVEGATLEDDDIPALENEIESYIHGLKRYLKTKNLKIEQLAPKLADSTKPFDVEIQLISMASGIPKRILMGSERGELASSQDASEWDDKVEERRTNFCTPCILNPFVDRLISISVLPEPKNGYESYWSPMHVMGEKEKAEIAKTWTESVTKYAGTPGSEFIIPIEEFLREIMGFDDKKVERIVKKAEDAMNEERARIKEESLALDAAAAAQKASDQKATGKTPQQGAGVKGRKGENGAQNK